MNHGIVNVKYYIGTNKSCHKRFYEDYPQLLIFKNYFARLKSRDTYYMVMKYHAIMLSKEIYPEISLKQLADVINLKNHTSALHLKRNFKKPYDYDDFIEKFDYLIENFLYPLTQKIEKKKYEECFYSLVHIPAKEAESTPKSEVIGKRFIKRKT